MIDIVQKALEKSSCPFVKMIPPLENHFGKITAWSLIYFLNYAFSRKFDASPSSVVWMPNLKFKFWMESMTSSDVISCIIICLGCLRWPRLSHYRGIFKLLHHKSSSPVPASRGSPIFGVCFRIIMKWKTSLTVNCTIVISAQLGQNQLWSRILIFTKILILILGSLYVYFLIFQSWGI